MDVFLQRRVLRTAVIEGLESRRLLAAVLVEDLVTDNAGSGVGHFVEYKGKTYFTNHIGPATGIFVTDGTPGGTKQVVAMNAESLFVHDGWIYFSGDDGARGYELWRTDGTAAGTELVKEFYAGSVNGSPRSFASFNGELYFSAHSAQEGRELWKSDGTESGTTLVADLNPGARDTSPEALTVVKDHLLFVPTGDYFPGGREIWRTDGTSQGTRLVKDIGPVNNPFLYPGFVFLNGVAYFLANDGARGNELWRTDGTDAGTQLVAEVGSGTKGVSSNLVLLGNQLYFSAWHDTFSHGVLWKSNGTAAGTVEAVRWSGGSPAGGIVVANDRMYFERGSGEFWTSDGTPGGTRLLRTFPHPLTQGGNLITSAGGRVYVYVTDAASGQELWTSDGTVDGTRRVKDIYLGQRGGSPAVFGHFNGVTYLRADDGVHGSELWRTDGTEAGTFLVKDVGTGTLGSSPTQFFSYNDVLYFSGRNSTGVSGLWRSDGTEAGTQPVKAFQPGIANNAFGNFTLFNGLLYFTKDDGVHGMELWRTDGTEAGTAVIDLNAGSASTSPSSLTVFRDELYFVGKPFGQSAPHLWKTDGTVAGTTQVENVAWPSSSPPSALVTSEDFIFFRGTTVRQSPYLQSELWRTDGTAAGTRMVIDLEGEAASGIVQPIREFDGGVIFSSAQSTTYGFWRSDGTAEGTQRIFASPDVDLRQHARLGDKLILALQKTIWVTDGTATGTFQLPGLSVNLGTDRQWQMVSMGGFIYFVADDGVHGHELWRTDGTIEGTSLVVDILPGWTSSTPTYLEVVGDQIFFAADARLWRTDGTAAGTVQVPDLMYGRSRYVPLYLKNAGGTLFFSASTPEFGSELWKVAAPVASAGSGYTAGIGGSVRLDAAGTFDPDPKESFSFAWDLDGDGVFGEVGTAAVRGDEVGSRPTFVAPGVVGEYVVKVRVTNSVGMKHEAAALVNVRGPGLVGSAGDDRYVIRLEGSVVRVVETVAGKDPVTFDLDASLAKAITFSGMGGDDQVTVDLSGATTVPADVLLSVLGGNVRVSVAGGESMQLRAANDASVRLVQDRLKLGKLTVIDSAVVRLVRGGGKVLRVEELQVGPSGTLDLGDGDLIVQPGTGVDRAALLSLIRARVASAYNGGAWDRPGITSSAAKEDLAKRTGLAVVENGEGGRRVRTELGGEALDADSIFLRVTWAGDADGNGNVDADDYWRVDRGFLRRLASYQWGDSDWNGAVDLDDYVLIDRVFLASEGAVFA